MRLRPVQYLQVQAVYAVKDQLTEEIVGGNIGATDKGGLENTAHFEYLFVDGHSNAAGNVT